MSEPLRDTETIRAVAAKLAEMSRLISWCRHGEADRGETIDRLDVLVNDAFKVLPPESRDG